METLAYKHLEIKDNMPTKLPETLESDRSPEGTSLKELLCIECDVRIPIKFEGDEDDVTVVQLLQGGDMAAFHAAYALASPVDKVTGGCCARCNLTKKDWTDGEANKCAWLRTFAYQCVANHVNVFKLPGFREKFPDHAAPICPHCGVTVDAALEQQEMEEYENRG